MRSGAPISLATPTWEMRRPSKSSGSWRAALELGLGRGSRRVVVYHRRIREHRHHLCCETARHVDKVLGDRVKVKPHEFWPLGSQAAREGPHEKSFTRTRNVVEESHDAHLGPMPDRRPRNLGEIRFRA